MSSSIYFLFQKNKFKPLFNYYFMQIVRILNENVIRMKIIVVYIRKN